MLKIRQVLLCLLLVVVSVANAQSKQVTGQVTSEGDGKPVIGASILVVGEEGGAITDLDGKFSLQVAEEGVVLRVSFIGMETKEVQVGNQGYLNIVLSGGAVNIDEVVITAFGISRNKKALGYASTEVSSDQMLQKSESDMLRSLDGKVAGVEIRSSGGAPGSAARVTIRGNTSFSGNNQPLFVVDGIPYSNDFVTTSDLSTGGGAYGSGLSTLDPNDIETTTVLKGAAAAALYGSRAKNGVILITTKSSSNANKNKGFKITVNSSVNIETIANLPDYQNTYGNGSDFDYQNANGSWGPSFESLDSVKNDWSNGDIYADHYGWGDSIPWVAQPNNVKDLFQTGVSFDNSVNISGGSDISSFNMTVSDSRNEGYIPNSKFNRTGISLGGSAKLHERFTIGGNLAFTFTNQSGGIYGNNQSSNEGGASSMARSLWLGRSWLMNPYKDPLTGGPVQPNGDQFDNPLWSWENNTVDTKMYRTVAGVNMTFKLTDWLSASYRGGNNYFSQNRVESVNKGSRYIDYEGKGGIKVDNYSTNEIESQLFLNFDKQINNDFRISGLVGLNHNQRNSWREVNQGKFFVSEGIFSLNNTEEQSNLASSTTKRRNMGLLGEATLDYKSWAFFTVRGRKDWSSTLPEANNSYFYPAVDGAFIFTEALGIENSTFSFGKVRASWGKVGQDASAYSISNPYTTAKPFLGQSYLYQSSTLYDVNLRPEFKRDIEVGAELNFIDNRIRVDAAYYHSKSTDMIYPVYIAPSSGYSNYYTNVGELINQGIELSVEATVVDTKDFDWDLTWNFTKNKSEVTDINGKDSIVYVSQLFGDPRSALIIGESYGVFHGSRSARDANGNILIDPATGLMLEDPESAVIGDPNPDFVTSIMNNFKYKGVTLSFLFDLKYGGDLYSNSIVSLLGRGVTKDTEDRERTVIIPGVYGDANTVTPITDGSGNNIQNQTAVSVNDLYFSSGLSSFAINSYGEWQVYDATVLRLREISLGYELPRSMLMNTFLDQVHFSLSARNLWYWAPFIPKYTNFDPELSTYGSSNVMGVEYSGQPSTRRYGFNVKVVF